MMLSRPWRPSRRRRDNLVGLAGRLGVHRWHQSLGLALAGIALGAPIAGLSAIHHAGLDSIRQSTRAEFGYANGWKLQASTKAAEAVARSAGVTGVRVSGATVIATGSRTDSTIWRLSNDQAPLGLLAEGRRAESSGEVTVSRHLADTLDVEPGSRLTLQGASGSGAEVRVVGITTDPADRNSDLVIGLEPSATPEQTTYWLTRTVSPELDSTPGLTAVSARGTAQARIDEPPGGLAAVARSIPVVAVVAALVMLAAVAGHVPGARRDSESLQAAGMARARAWRVALVWMAALVALGAGVGSVTAWAILRWLRDPVSKAFGQRWTELPIPVGALILVVALPLAAAFVPVRMFEKPMAWLRHFGPSEDGRRDTTRLSVTVGALLGLAGSALVVLALLAAQGTVDNHHPELLGIGGTLGVVLGIHLGAQGLVGYGRARATGRVARRLAGHFSVGTAAALVVATLCSGYSAWHTHNTYALATVDTAPQSAGSFLVYQAPSAAARQILSAFRAMGGHDAFVYDLPDESRGSVRVTNSGTVDCIHAGPVGSGLLNTCLQRPGAVMNIPALDSDLAPQETLVEPGVLDSTGQAGVVTFGADGRTIARTGIIPAVVSRSLGGNMPGMLMSPDNPLAKTYRLVPSGLVELGMMDFGELGEKDAARIRDLVASIAPAAQTSDTTSDSSQEQRLALSLLVALLGAALVLMVQSAASVAAISGSSRTRRALAAAGMPRASRVRITFRVVAPSVLSVVVAGVLVALVAPRVGYPVAASTGSPWLLPVLTQLAVLSASAWFLLRTPRG